MQARPEDRLAEGQLIEIDVALAFRLMNLNRFEAARPILEECLATLARSSTNGELDDEARYKTVFCHSCLTRMCSEASRLDEALSHGLNACALLEPQDSQKLREGRLTLAVNCHLVVGQLYSRLGRTDEARRWLEDHKYWLEAQAAYESTQPFNAVLHYHWLNTAGSKDEAASYLRNAVQSHPKDRDLAKTLANELVATAKGGPPSEEDIAFLRDAFRSSPDEVDLGIWLSQRLIAAADFIPPGDKRKATLDEARIALTSVAELAEHAAANQTGNVTALIKFGQVYQQLCHCLIQLGRREEAIAVFRKLISAQKSLQPRKVIDIAAEDAYWREVATTILTMRPFLDEQQTSSTEDFLRSRLREMQFQPRSEGHLGWLVIVADVKLVIRMRRLEQVDDAKRLVAEMSRYAQALVDRHPNDAYAQLALYEAQIHVFKNAERYKSGNSEAALRLALDAAQRALVISPGNAKVHAAVADCRQRLERIKTAS